MQCSDWGMTIWSLIWDVVLMVMGIVIGYVAAIKYDLATSQKSFRQAQERSMNALVSSLKRNSENIDQMFRVEFPEELYPSYPLDTVALALINFDARHILPANTNWPATFNTLRFQMDHINRKLLFNYWSNVSIEPQFVKTTY